MDMDVHVKVAAANGRRSDLDDDIVWMLDFRQLDLFHGNFERTLVVNGFHLVFRHVCRYICSGRVSGVVIRVEKGYNGLAFLRCSHFG